MNRRIYQLRNYLKLTQQEFANKIGLSHGSISDIEKGKAPITDRTILLICNIFNVNEEWLRTGNGEMLNIIDVKFDEFFKIYSDLSKPLQHYLLTCAKELLKTQDKL